MRYAPCVKLPEPGDRIADKYRIDAILGEGGFGRVYLAQTDETARQVAIKVLTPSGTGYPHIKVRRFLRELKNIAQLSHPNTMTLYDYGRTDEGLLYMVCEYIAGEDLSQLLERRGRLTERETVHILLQTLESLREAHHAGLLHRDIKPDNLRLTHYQGDSLVVKVLDFGIAKSLEGDQPNLTATGKVIGTPRYMSPEQLTGEPLTAASDIFSLGLVASDMLLGQTAGSLRRVAMAQRGIEASDEISEPLRTVVNRMLATDVTRRFQTAEQALHALRSLEPSSLQPRPPERGLAVGRVVELGAVPSTSEDGERPAPDIAKVRSWTLIAAVGGVVIGGLLTFAALSMRAPAVPAPARATRAVTLPGHALVKQQTRAVDDAAAFTTIDAGAPFAPDIGVGLRAGCGPNPMPRDGGDYRLYEGRLPDGDVSYYEPEDYDGKHAYPIVLLLHSATQTDVRMFNDSGFREVADEHGLVVIAPRHPSLMTWRGADAVPIVERAIEYVSDRMCLDRSRIYVLGHAAGAALAEELPCLIPGVRGIATTAYRSRDGQSCERNVPRIQFTGLEDGYLPPAGGPGCNGLSVESLADYEAAVRERHVCAEAATEHLKRDGHRCWTWDCKVPLVSCHLDGGRGFRAQKKRGLDALLNCDGDPPDFDIAGTAWTFFAQTDAPTP